MMFECIDKIYPSVSIDTLTGSIVSFNDEYGGLPLKSCVSQISGYQEGSGTPSPDNVRPLHAWSGASLGVNTINIWDEQWEVGAINYNNGNPQVNINNIRSKNFIPVVPNTNYYIKAPNRQPVIICGYDQNKNFIDNLLYNNADRSFTITSDSICFIKFCTIGNPNYGSTYNYDISINYPATDTSYHAFSGAVFTFGQSIYQGYIDWKRGVVVGTWGIDVYDGSNDENWGVQSKAGFWIDNTAKKAGRGNYLADNYQATDLSGWDISTPNGYFSGHPTIQRLYFRTPYEGFELSLENWRSWLSSNPITVVYELATPIEIPLGGINLLTQEGQNNFFCDTGDTTIEYINIT